MNGKQAKALRKAAVLAHYMGAFDIGPIVRGTTRYEFLRNSVRTCCTLGTCRLKDCPRRTMQQLKKAKRAA